MSSSEGENDSAISEPLTITKRSLEPATTLEARHSGGCVSNARGSSYLVFEDLQDAIHEGIVASAYGRPQQRRSVLLCRVLQLLGRPNPS